MQRKLSEADLRTARLAVFRYGASQDDVLRLMESYVESSEPDQESDLLDFFHKRKILSLRQVQDLRFGLNQTLIDANLPPAEPPKNGRPAAAVPNQSLHAILNDSVHQLGEYRLLRQLGEGGMGVVYLAYDKHRNRQVALKVLAPEVAGVEGSLDRFLREGQSGLALNHPNIVRNHAVEIDAATSLHYLVLEYVDGSSAHEVLEKHGPLKVGDAVHIVYQVATALEYAHRNGIVHRDIKPGNILITSAGVVKLTDMGLAKKKNETSHLTHHRQGIGTPHYMPYEQALNAKTADERSDIYALGATLYQLLTGEVPFPGDTPMEVIEKKKVGFYPPVRYVSPDVPEALDVILAKMLAVSPADRYQTASELLVELERSKLSSKVLSFVSLDQALKDPVVRQRLTVEVPPTAPDLRLDLPEANALPTHWFIRYRDKAGKIVVAKVALEELKRRLQSGRIPAGIQVSQQQSGGFKPANSLDEFRELIPKRRPSAKPDESVIGTAASSPLLRQSWFWVAVSLGVLTFVLMAVVVALIR